MSTSVPEITAKFRNYQEAPFNRATAFWESSGIDLFFWCFNLMLFVMLPDKIIYYSFQKLRTIRTKISTVILLHIRVVFMQRHQNRMAGM